MDVNVGTGGIPRTTRQVAFDRLLGPLARYNTQVPSGMKWTLFASPIIQYKPTVTMSCHQLTLSIEQRGPVRTCLYLTFTRFHVTEYINQSFVRNLTIRSSVCT